MTEDKDTSPITINPFDLNYLIKVIWKRKILMAITLAVGLIAAFIYNQQSDPYYKVNTKVKSNIITAAQATIILKDLPAIINNKDDLEQVFGTNSDIGSSIKTLRFSTVKEDIFDIQVVSYDPQKVPLITSGILYFLRNSSYVKENLKREALQLKNNLIQVKEEIEDLEIIKEQLNKLLTNQTNSNVTIISPSEIYLMLIELRSQERDLNEQITELKDFEVLNEPMIPNQPAGPNKMKRLFIAAILSFGTGLFISLFIENLN